MSSNSDRVRIRFDRDGVVTEASESANHRFGRNLRGAAISDFLTSSTGEASWETHSGERFLEVFGTVRANDRSVEMVLVPAGSDDTPPPGPDPLLRIARDLIRASSSEIDDAAVEALGRIGRASHVDRVSVVRFDEDGIHARITHEWTRAGAEPHILSLLDLERAQFRWFEECASRDGYLLVRSLEELPDASAKLRANLEQQGIRSLLIAGMFEDGALAGLLRFDSSSDETRWSQHSVERLTLVADLLIQSILRAWTDRDLQETNEVFRLAQLATRDVIWDWNLETGEIRRSSGIENQLGYTLEESEGSPEWWMNQMHPDDRATAERLLDSFDEDFIQYEYRIKHKKGHWIHVLDRGTVVRDQARRPVRIVGVTADVTDRITAVQKLRESEARLRAVVENVSDVIGIVGISGTILYHSPSSASTFGYSPVELAGTDMFELVHPDDRDLVRKVFSASIEGGQSAEQTTFRFRHGMGHWISLETVFVNMLEDENVSGVLLVSRDITARQRAEHQIERSNRLASLGHMASLIAHEFNNVLMGAQPFLDVLKRTDDPKRIRTAVERIDQALQKGKSVSRGILQFSRPLSISLETIDLKRWCEEVEEEIRRLLPGTIELRLILPDHEVPAVVDRDALYEAVLTLVLRAKNAMEPQPSGSLEIAIRSDTDSLEDETAGHPSGFVVVVLRDDGPRADLENQHSLFEPDRAVHPRSGSDSRLSLSVAHKLIAAQNGKLMVESSDAGTTFAIHLRAGLGHRDPEHRELSPDPPAPSRTILLVEDDEIVASGITAVLEIEGQKVEIAGTGAQALEFLERAPPALVILDIGLPDMSGIELFEKIEKIDPNLPIVFSSGHGDQQQIQSYLDRPNVEFLLKPYDASTLLSVVERLLTLPQR